MDREKNWRTNLSCPRIDFQTKTRIIEYESLHFSSPLSLCYESEVDFLTNLFPSYRLLHPCWNKPAAASLAVRAPQVKPRNQTSGLASNKSLKHHFRICGLYQTIYIYISNEFKWYKLMWLGEVFALSQPNALMQHIMTPRSGVQQGLSFVAGVTIHAGHIWTIEGPSCWHFSWYHNVPYIYRISNHIDLKIIKNRPMHSKVILCVCVSLSAHLYAQVRYV